VQFNCSVATTTTPHFNIELLTIYHNSYRYPILLCHVFSVIITKVLHSDEEMGYSSIDGEEKASNCISEKWLVHIVLISVQFW